MLVDRGPAMQAWHEAMRHWGVTPVEDLGGRGNKHWLVESGGARLVLRAYAPDPWGWNDIGYELRVLRRLRELGWPVSVAVEEPIQFGGRTWCLFTWLPGASRASDSPEEQRRRGRLLARLHDSTTCMADMGQRSGFGRSDELICDPELVASIRAYERLYPIEGHIMRWHLEETQSAFERIDVKPAETVVLHGDFTRWNLLFEDESLTGVLDFEATHLNYRVADFALSWRGQYVEVITGYQEVQPLTELDRELLVPAYWSWIFIGAKREINAMMSGDVPHHRFEWHIKQLMKRSGEFSRQMPRYSET